jgi:hypothetical protein
MTEPTKYNIVISEGCTTFGTMINGRLVSGDEDSMTNDEIDQFADYLCEKFKEKLKQNAVSLDDLIKCFQCDDYEYNDNPCGTCGDITSSTTWNI